MDKHITEEAAKSTTLEELLSKLGVSESQITEIYSGKDHDCRCGCKGTYTKPEYRSYKRILNALKKTFIDNTVRTLEVEYSDLSDGSVDYINIPNGDAYKDHCYCLYFRSC